MWFVMLIANGFTCSATNTLKNTTRCNQGKCVPHRHGATGGDGPTNLGVRRHGASTIASSQPAPRWAYGCSAAFRRHIQDGRGRLEWGASTIASSQQDELRQVYLNQKHRRPRYVLPPHTPTPSLRPNLLAKYHLSCACSLMRPHCSGCPFPSPHLKGAGLGDPGTCREIRGR